MLTCSRENIIVDIIEAFAHLIFIVTQLKITNWLILEIKKQKHRKMK